MTPFKWCRGGQHYKGSALHFDLFTFWHFGILAFDILTCWHLGILARSEAATDDVDEGKLEALAASVEEANERDHDDLMRVLQMSKYDIPATGWMS